MIGGLGELMQDADVATRLCSGGEDGQSEVVTTDHLRAGEGEEDASGPNLLESRGVEFAIPLEGVAEHVAMLGEGRRIEDDKVVIVSGTSEVVKGVFGKGAVTVVVGKVEGDVALGQVDGFRGAIDGVYRPRTAAHGVDGEAAGVAKHIQHRATAGVLL